MPAAQPTPQGPPQGETPPQLIRLAEEISAATGAPPQVVIGFIRNMAENLLPQIGPEGFRQRLRQVLNMPPPQLTQLLLDFANSPAGAGIAGPPTGPPPGGQPPGMVGPGGPVSSPPPPSPIEGPPPTQGGPSPLPGQGPPERPKPVAPKKAKKKPRPDRADPWQPDELPDPRYKGGPEYKTVIAHADDGRRFYADLTEAFQTWRDIWHMVEDDKEKIDRTQADDSAGDDVWHTRAQPTTMGMRIIGMTSPSLDRLGIHAPPYDDTDECRESAQRCENFVRSALDEIARLWDRRATSGDYRPPFDRTLSGLATIEGGYAFRVMPNPKRKGFPWDVEPVPLMEMFPRPLSTTRQVECTLGEAYAYEELKELLPPPDKDASDPPYDSDSRVRLITWTDETHYCIVAEFCLPEVGKKAKERTGTDEYWIVKPQEHKLGRRIYLVPNPWNSDPLGPSASDTGGRARYLAQGIYAPLVGTIKYVNKMVSGLGSGVFKAIHTTKKWKLDPTMRQAHGGFFPPIDYNQAHIAGGNVVLGPGEDVESIIDDMAASPSGQAFLQSLLGDLGDVAPPVLGGRGAAESGFDRFQASEAAGVLHVDPIRRYHLTSLQYLAEVLLTDMVRLGEGEGKLFKKLPYRQRTQRGTTKRGGYMATLTAKDVRRNGPYVEFKFRDDNQTQQLQLTNLMLMQVKEHLRSRVSAMDELGIDDTERERLLMFAEAALEAPDVIKAAIRAALEAQAAEHELEADGSVNESALMLGALDKMLEAQQMQQQEKGLPSPPGAPPGQPPPPGAPSGGLPAVMSGA